MSTPGITESESETDAEPRRRWSLLAILPLVVFLATAWWLFRPSLFVGDPSLVPSALIGKPVPTFALAPVEGTDKPGLATADLQQGGVTLINVFASWCVPCREEAPQLRQLEGKGLHLVGIAYKDKPADTRRFLNIVGDPYARIGADVAGRTGIDFGVYGVPETYVVDGRGIIQAKIVGPLTDGNIEDKLLPAIAKAKGTKDAKPPA